MECPLLHYIVKQYLLKSAVCKGMPLTNVELGMRYYKCCCGYVWRCEFLKLVDIK